MNFMKIIIILIQCTAIFGCTDSSKTASQRLSEKSNVKYYKDISKQGDLVVWGISSDLILKTVVGDKTNIAKGTILSSPFLGQFPINFIPKIKSLKENDTIENVADRENPMQFNLILNNAKNIEINNFYDTSHKNQVKVLVENFSTADPIYLRYKKTPREWINYFTSQEVIKDEDLSKKFDLECYSLKNLKAHISRFYHCIGNASDPYHSEFLMIIAKQHERNNQIVVTTEVETPLYPNISIKWTMPYESLKDWKKVDKNIWRLLKAWNVHK